VKLNLEMPYHSLLPTARFVKRHFVLVLVRLDLWQDSEVGLTKCLLNGDVVGNTMSVFGLMGIYSTQRHHMDAP
jgi:hypothetical protein